jgi:DNA-binding NarL/FixJ family response regulator
MMFMTLPSTEVIPDVSEKRKNIRVVIADDHPITRDALKKLLAREEDIEVVGEAGDGREALDRVQELNPDVLLLDLRMPNLDGLSVLQMLQQSNRNMKVIVVTAFDDRDELVKAMELGCSGIVLKQTATDVIEKSIRKVHAGELWLDTHAMAVMMRQCPSSADVADPRQSKGRAGVPLTGREREIMVLAAQGYTNKEMAQKMIIGEQTVKNHLHNIYATLGFSNRLELALYAIHQGLHLGEKP